MTLQQRFTMLKPSD